MKINISLNEVLRDFIGQLTYTYNKYIAETSIKEGEVKSLDLIKFFPFPTIVELNKFLYMEAPLEIFGHADQSSDGLMNRFNYLVQELKDEGHEVQLVSKEVDKSIPSTHFFLSKTGCRAPKILFVDDPRKEWSDADILISANPDALFNKPKNKIAVKIKASYNENVAADFELDGILEFIKDESLRSKILNTRITTFEEI